MIDTAGSGMRQWWRRNALWLAAVAVLAPVMVGGIVWHEFTERFETTQWRETRVAPGESLELAGATLGPASSETLPMLEGLEQPRDTRIVIVTLPIQPGDAPLSCYAPLLIEQGTGREWVAAYAPLGWAGETSCFEATTPLELRLPYVVPADAGPFEFELQTAGGEDERLPRFILETP